MADDIRTLTAQLARDPDSLVFVQLGELLRVRGQLSASRKVVVAGLERHPSLIEGHDLYARILSDSGDLNGAEREWRAVLEANQRHLGAHKGLGFTRFRQGDMDGALDHLELALSIDPTDPAVVQALKTVRAAAETGTLQPDDAAGAPAASMSPEDPREGRGARPETGAIFAGLEGAEQGMLLVDALGRVLGGAVWSAKGEDASELVAAQASAVAQEAERTARILGLGGWLWLVAETESGIVHLSQPASSTALLLVRDRSVPAGRLTVLAEKAAAVARQWLEAQAL